MILSLVVVTILVLVQSASCNEELLIELNQINPSLFNHFSNDKLKYFDAQNQLRKILKFNLNDSNCIVNLIESIVKKANEHRNKLQIAGDYLRGFMFDQKIGYFLDYPDVEIIRKLNKICIDSALDCIEEIASQAKSSVMIKSVSDYKTTAAIYLCWYTLNSNPLLSQFRTVNCTNSLSNSNLFNYYDGLLKNSIEFSCATLSFCPDLCCGKVFRKLSDSNRIFQNEYELLLECKKSDSNPCYAKSDGLCRLSTSENKDLLSLKQNRLNITCSCSKGKKWSHKYEQCVDLDECLEHKHECNGYKQVCLNTIGSYECICEHGYHKLNNQCVPTQFNLLDSKVFNTDLKLDELKSLNFAQCVFH